MQHDAAAFKAAPAELGPSLELRLETRLCGERGGWAAQTRSHTGVPGPPLVSEAAASAAAAFWCVERPILPGATLKLFSMSWSIGLLESYRYIYKYIHTHTETAAAHTWF